MADPEALADLDQRIAVIRDNLRELVEQAAAYSGAADEFAHGRPHRGSGGTAC